MMPMGAPVIASPVSQDVTKMGKSPGYSPEEIAAMAQYYGADAYDPNMYMYLHNMAVDRTGVGRKYDSTGTLLLDGADFAPAGLQMDGSGLGGIHEHGFGRFRQYPESVFLFEPAGHDPRIPRAEQVCREVGCRRLGIGVTEADTKQTFPTHPSIFGICMHSRSRRSLQL